MARAIAIVHIAGDIRRPVTDEPLIVVSEAFRAALYNYRYSSGSAAALKKARERRYLCFDSLLSPLYLYLSTKCLSSDSQRSTQFHPLFDYQSLA